MRRGWERCDRTPQPRCGWNTDPAKTRPKTSNRLRPTGCGKNSGFVLKGQGFSFVLKGQGFGFVLEGRGFDFVSKVRGFSFVLKGRGFQPRRKNRKISVGFSR